MRGSGQEEIALFRSGDAARVPSSEPAKAVPRDPVIDQISRRSGDDQEDAESSPRPTDHLQDPEHGAALYMNAVAFDEDDRRRTARSIGRPARLQH